MKNNSIDKKKIESLLPHRDPMLLIDKLINIIHLKSATAIVNVKKSSFFVQGHFPGQPVMPGVLIVEAFGQAAAALTAYSLNPGEVENKLVYHITENNENGISLYCSTKKILSMTRFVPGISKDKLPDISSASIND